MTCDYCMYECFEVTKFSHRFNCSQISTIVVIIDIHHFMWYIHYRVARVKALYSCLLLAMVVNQGTVVQLMAMLLTVYTLLE